tara:strand:- start:1790 stop:2593 length:804 start_codon:yes stop_codon:yes gene_type:complete
MSELNNQDTNEYFILVKNIKPNTQKYILSIIFEKNKRQWLSKRYIEKEYGLRWSLRMLSDIDIKNISSIEELINKARDVPGDLQRNLRTFYDHYSKYGLEKKEKTRDNELMYKWNPILKSKLEDIVHPVTRNIFKTTEEIEIFKKSKNNECEMCIATPKDCKTLRMAIDHWRAHSIYNIDDKKLAVLLCETCNNIHHNYDASKIPLKYKNDMEIVKKWVKKENEIRSNGFQPNESDRLRQQNIISEINTYYKSLNNPLQDSFWEGLL